MAGGVPGGDERSIFGDLDNVEPMTGRASGSAAETLQSPLHARQCASSRLAKKCKQRLSVGLHDAKYLIAPVLSFQHVERRHTSDGVSEVA